MSLNAENVTQRPISRTSGAGSEKTFEAKFFTLTVEEAAKQPPGKEYDIIIVGSGIGGGVLAHDLYDTNIKLGNKAKRVLLLEKGGVVFHSHCLNTARPAGLANDRGQQNDTFFNASKTTIAAWGLFAPRIHDSVLKNHFHPQVTRELQWNYYDKAERLMLLSIPTSRRIHQRIMDRLNLDGLEAEKDSNIQWKWGRIASEFQEEKNFDFAEGAYSSIDKILEIAMSRPQKQDANGAQIPVEHEHFKTVLNADVRSLNFDKDKNVTGVNVRTAGGKMVPINVRQGGNVVLSAGSVHSPAILLQSGDSEWQSRIRDHGGLRLTDHDILSYSCSFRYSDPDHRSEYGAMKLQTYVEIGDHIALAKFGVDSSQPGGLRANGTPKWYVIAQG
ncbi:GMC oxidoreductase [Rhizoctonia solani]|uniref:GMC oxidoreductase n=1 Tax=Rhizoctonia solani TaxID=456999 RepID=A0A8H7LI83_9AGAM|nr:GMC oxidoreductase [Rhizoctonia solani]